MIVLSKRQTRTIRGGGGVTYTAASQSQGGADPEPLPTWPPIGSPPP